MVNLLPDTSIYGNQQQSLGSLLQLLKLVDASRTQTTPSATPGLPPEITTGTSAPRAAGGSPSIRISTAEAANDTAYIRQAATARGMDPNVAVKVAASEGLFDYTGDQGSSFGPFQLHYGGMASGGNAVSGLGDEFTKATGLHARDPSTKKAQIDFALDHAAQHGWGPWHGWKGDPFAGIGPKSKPLGLSPASTADIKAAQAGSGQASAYAEENTRRAPGASKLDASGNEIVSRPTKVAAKPEDDEEKFRKLETPESGKTVPTERVTTPPQPVPGRSFKPDDEAKFDAMEKSDAKDAGFGGPPTPEQQPPKSLVKVDKSGVHFSLQREKDAASELKDAITKDIPEGSSRTNEIVKWAKRYPEEAAAAAAVGGTGAVLGARAAAPALAAIPGVGLAARGIGHVLKSPGFQVGAAVAGVPELGRLGHAGIHSLYELLFGGGGH